MRPFTLIAISALSNPTTSQSIQLANNTPHAIHYTCAQGPAATQTCAGSLAPHSKTTIPYPASGQNVSVKMKPSPNSGAGTGAHLQFELATAGSSTSYNLSFLNGDPFNGLERSVVPSDAGCGSVRCAARDQSCGYRVAEPNPAAVPVVHCHTGAVLTVNIGAPA